VMKIWPWVLTVALGMSQVGLAQDMPITQVIVDGKDWELVASGFKFTEGPAVDATGQVFFTDIPNERIHKVDLAGHVSVFVENSGKTNGLMFGPDGRLYGCRNGDKKIVAYKADGSFDTLAEDVNSNDLVVTSRGGIYFTDPPGKRVWYINPAGQKRVVAEGFRPNGVILWPKEETLVVTDSDQPHLWTFRVEADGSLAHREAYYRPLQIPSRRDKPGSDGMKVDDEYRLYVATAAGIQMFDPTGRLGGTILKPVANKPLSNLVFGGPKFDVIYATCGDKLFRRQVKPVSRPYFLRSPK
jgi:gluconolactonase